MTFWLEAECSFRRKKKCYFLFASVYTDNGDCFPHSDIFRVFLSVFCPQFSPLSLFIFLLVSVLWMEVETQTGWVCPVVSVPPPPTSLSQIYTFPCILLIQLVIQFSFHFLACVVFFFFFLFFKDSNHALLCKFVFHPIRLLPLKPREPGSQSLKYHHWSQVANRENCSTTS